MNPSKRFIFFIFCLICLVSAEKVEGEAPADPGYRAESAASLPGMDPGTDVTWETLDRDVKPFVGALVDTIIIRGNTHTRRKTVVREMATKQGERLDRSVILRDYSYLRGMGYFSWVEISVVAAGPGRCTVTVDLTERAGVFMWYPLPVVNYDLDKGVSYGFRWKIKNFRGVGEELYSAFEKRRGKEHGGRVSWYIPWVGGYRLRLNTSFFIYRRLEEPEKDDFIKDRNGGQVSVGLPLSKSLVRQVWLTPSVSLENRYSRLSIPGNINYPTGSYFRQIYLAYGFTLSCDSRDNVISPRRGNYCGASFFKFSSIHGGEQQYSFYKLSDYLHIPIMEMGTLILAFDADNRDGALPSFYEMGLGGTSDLRGFHSDNLRGSSKIISTIQWRSLLYGPAVFSLPWIGKFDLTVNGTLFVDNGALMDSFEDIRDSRYHTTGGFGLEIISPIQDLVRVEMAFSETKSPVFYVTSGGRF